jgi:hypothetical protein
LLKGTEVEEGVLPNQVAVEAVAIEPVVVEPSTVETTTTAPEVKTEVRVDPPLGSSPEVVIRKAIVEEIVPLRSVPMQESGSSSCEGLKLLDDELIDPAVVVLNLESWHHTEQWVIVCHEYPE